MKLRALLGWGIVIYAISTLASTGMELYGFTGGLMPHILELVVLFCVCVIAGSTLRLRWTVDVFAYSIGWAVIFLILSGVFYVPLAGWHLYDSWMLWADAVLVALFPLCASLFTRPRVPRSNWDT